LTVTAELSTSGRLRILESLNHRGRLMYLVGAIYWTYRSKIARNRQF